VTRLVRLVLVDAGGLPRGVLPPYPVGTPWWQEAADVVAGARLHFGLDVAVLRILGADRPEPPGGTVTYVAEAAGPLPAVATPLAAAGVDPAAVTRPEPRRAPWAEPGGPARSLAWALRGWPGDAAVSQRRTWNLSAIWRLDAPGRRAWLKQVPPFFRHEAAVLRWLAEAAPGRAPTLLAADGEGRLLLDDVPGDDWYDADTAGRGRILAIAHDIQRLGIRAADTLVRAGVPDRRGPALSGWIRGTLGPDADAALPDLDARIAAAGGCGLPDTLVHGDLHPGNTRVALDTDPVLIDWGDAVVGSPVFDILRLTAGVDAGAATTLLAAWAARWRAVAPGSDPERAVALLRPVAALRAAATYAEFLTRIEPAEHPYHAADVPRWLREARAAADGHTVWA